MLPMNEEEVKAKIILPWLQQIGVELSELSLEKSFTFRAGRHTIEVDTGKQLSSTVGARLDILVKRRDNNLLIVEVKRSNSKLTDAGRDQAISYSRLVHPVAPFALVTNGHDYKLFDTITKQPIKPEDTKIDGEYTVALPEESRNEALRLFLGYSRENLLTFCKEQVNDLMQPLKGSSSDLTKKYILELHVPRAKLAENLNNFLDSDKVVFILLGDSGMGKTSSLCHLALEMLAQKKPILFFGGLNFEQGILESITAEFEWTFSEHANSIALIKKLEEITTETPLTIFIDGIDEWSYSQRVQNLSNLIRHLHNRKIKLVLGCKTSSWGKYLEQKGTSTGISQFLHCTGKSKSKAKHPYSHALEPFSEREFYLAIDRYRHVFNFFGGFEDRVLRQAKSNPFLLRILFDVAKSSKLKHITFDSKEFFKRYYNDLIAKTARPEVADNSLKAVAKTLYDKNTDWVDEDFLRNSLGLRVNEILLDDLFDHNILTRTEESQKKKIGFYFQQLRDYIVAFKSLGWQQMNTEDFQETIDDIHFPSMRGEVLSFFYRHSSESQKRAFDGNLYENARQYLDFYCKTIEEHFPKLQSRFAPETKGRIGFIGELFMKRQCLAGYGFRPIESGDEDIFFFPVDEAFKSNLSYLYGADGLHYAGSANGFIDLDIKKEVITNEICTQLSKLVKEGRLYEDGNPDLLLELVVSLISSHRDIFSKQLNDQGTQLNYPILLDDIRASLKEAKLRFHFENVRIEEKRKAGEIKEQWSGSIVSYSCSSTAEDLVWIDDQVKKAMKAGEDICTRVVSVDLERIARRLEPALQTLSPKSRWIEAALFPEQDTILNEATYPGRSEGVTIDVKKSYIEKLYKAFFKNYQTLVETNFPTLKPHFTLYASMPIQAFIYVGQPMGDGSHSLWVYSCRAPEDVKENIVVMCENDIEMPWQKRVFKFRGREFKVINTMNTSFESLVFHGHYVDGLDIEEEGAILRRLVYRQLRTELGNVLKALLAIYGIKMELRHLF